MESGNYLWNCGYFVGSVNTFVSEMKLCAPILQKHFEKQDGIGYTTLLEAKSSSKFKMDTFNQMMGSPMLMTDVHDEVVPSVIKTAYGSGMTLSDYVLTTPEPLQSKTTSRHSRLWDIFPPHICFAPLPIADPYFDEAIQYLSYGIQLARIVCYRRRLINMTYCLRFRRILIADDISSGHGDMRISGHQPGRIETL